MRTIPTEEVMDMQSSGSKVCYAVVGLGNIAQVAVLPAWLLAPPTLLGSRMRHWYGIITLTALAL